MNLMHLRYFCKLAETQHYTLAASELYISQPGLSGAISLLEEELGIHLFEKKGRNIRLTKYGKEFYSYVKESLKVLDEGISVAQEHSGKLSGTIDIVSITTILGDYIPSIISNFKKKYPKINFRVHQGQTNDILQSLKNESYDIGFCTYNEPSEDITGIPVLIQNVVAVVDKQHPLAGRTSIKLADLADYPVLTYSLSQQVGRQFSNLLKENRLDCITNEVYCTERILAGIMQKDTTNVTTVGFMAQVPSLLEFPKLRCLPIDDIPKDFRTVYMVYNNRTFNTHAITLFINFVKNSYSLLSNTNDAAI